MNRSIAIATMLVVGLAPAAFAQKTPPKPQSMKTVALAAQAKPLSKAEWQKGYSEAAKMFGKKDAEGILSMTTPDFSMTSMGRTTNREQSIAGLKQWFGMMKTLNATMKVTNVVTKGGITTVTDSFRFEGMTMPDPKTHKSGKLANWGTETATWVSMDGKWKMKKIVSTNEKMTMNGKPFKPNM